MSSRSPSPGCRLQVSFATRWDVYRCCWWDWMVSTTYTPTKYSDAQKRSGSQRPNKIILAESKKKKKDAEIKINWKIEFAESTAWRKIPLWYEDEKLCAPRKRARRTTCGEWAWTRDGLVSETDATISKLVLFCRRQSSGATIYIYVIHKRSAPNAPSFTARN